MPAILGIAYLGLTHLAVIHRLPWLEWAALVLLCVIPMYGALRRGSLRHLALLGALASALGFLTFMGEGRYLLFIPPVLLPAMLLAVFAGSLRAGQTPLVERIAMRSHDGRLPPDRVDYCRNVTRVWVAVLAVQAVAAVLLAFLASPWLWSVITNGVNYVVLGLLFVGEYAYRRWRFPSQQHQGFLDHLKSIARVRDLSS